jgi:hypothetical protein
MKKESLPITPNRLFDVADAILRATQTEDGMSACVSVWIDEPPDGTPSLSTFTESECIEAMGLLIRMGYIDPQTAECKRRSRP